MQFTLSIIAASSSLLSFVVAMPAAPVITAPAVLRRDGFMIHAGCPASSTIVSGEPDACLQWLCDKPGDGPCDGTTTYTELYASSCLTREAWTVSLKEPCPDSGCLCPRATKTAYYDGECPASKTVRTGGCPEILCLTPTDGPCKGWTTETLNMAATCTAKPPTTTTMHYDCAVEQNCACPKATATMTLL